MLEHLCDPRDPDRECRACEEDARYEAEERFARPRPDARGWGGGAGPTGAMPTLGKPGALAALMAETREHDCEHEQARGLPCYRCLGAEPA